MTPVTTKCMGRFRRSLGKFLPSMLYLVDCCMILHSFLFNFPEMSPNGGIRYRSCL